MEIKNIKSVKSNRHLFRKIVAVTISLCVVGGSYYIISTANQDAKDTVETERLELEKRLEKRM